MDIRIQKQPLHRLLVHRQRPGLVAGNTSAGTQTFDRGQFSHDHVSLGHPLRGHRQGDRHRDGQPLWNRRNRQGDHDQEYFLQRFALNDFEYPQHQANTQHNKADLMAEFLHPDDDRRFAALGSRHR